MIVNAARAIGWMVGTVIAVQWVSHVLAGAVGLDGLERSHPSPTTLVIAACLALPDARGRMNARLSRSSARPRVAKSFAIALGSLVIASGVCGLRMTVLPFLSISVALVCAAELWGTAWSVRGLLLVGTWLVPSLLGSGWAPSPEVAARNDLSTLLGIVENEPMTWCASIALVGAVAALALATFRGAR